VTRQRHYIVFKEFGNAKRACVKALPRGQMTSKEVDTFLAALYPIRPKWHYVRATSAMQAIRLAFEQGLIKG
jgi:hypothetical protein